MRRAVAQPSPFCPGRGGSCCLAAPAFFAAWQAALAAPCREPRRPGCRRRALAAPLAETAWLLSLLSQSRPFPARAFLARAVATRAWAVAPREALSFPCRVLPCGFDRYCRIAAHRVRLRRRRDALFRAAASPSPRAGSRDRVAEGGLSARAGARRRSPTEFLRRGWARRRRRNPRREGQTKSARGQPNMPQESRRMACAPGVPPKRSNDRTDAR